MKLIGPLAGSEATTYSHFKFLPKHRKLRFNHSKVTCTSGSLVDHNCYRVKSNVARTAWDWKCLLNKNNLQKWQQIIPAPSSSDSDPKRQVFGSDGFQNKATAETKNQGFRGRQMYMVQHYKHQFMYQNRNKHPVFIELWDIVAKTSAQDPSLIDPFNMLDAFPEDNEGLAGAPVTRGFTGAADINIYHPDFKLWTCKQFYDVWQKKHYTRIRLQPGETHVHTVSASPKFVWDFYGIDSITGLQNWQGITQGTLMRAIGDVVHQETGSYLPTIDGTNIDVIEVTKVWLRQVDPWRDVFHYNIGTAYPSDNGARDAVGRVELEDPQDTLGKVD